MKSFGSQFRALQRSFLPIWIVLVVGIGLLIWLSPAPDHWAGDVIDGGPFEGCYRSADNGAMLKLEGNRLLAEDGSSITFSSFVQTRKTELIAIDPVVRFKFNPKTKTLIKMGPWPEGGSRVMQVGKARSIFANANSADAMLIPISNSGRMQFIKSSC